MNWIHLDNKWISLNNILYVTYINGNQIILNFIGGNVLTITGKELIKQFESKII